MTVSPEKLEELRTAEEIAKKDYNGQIKGKLQYGKKNAVNIYTEPEKLGEKITNNVKTLKIGENCILCGSNYTKYLDANDKNKSLVISSNNLIFDFGTGNSKPSFRDSRTTKNIPLCMMCDLIYRNGLMKNYFIDDNVFIISGPTLRFIEDQKLKLPNLNDNYLDVETKSKTNFLEKRNFPTTGMNSRLLLLLHKIYSEIIDKDSFLILSIFYFITTSKAIDELNVYNKMSYISKLFTQTDKIDTCDNNSLKSLFLYKLMNYAYYKKISTYKTKIHA